MTDASILDDLTARGLIHDATDETALRGRLGQGPVTLYSGFDPTADSLHVGNLVPLLVLRRFQDAGHRPIALAGGATGMIGDPSGRSDERNLLDDDVLAANVEAISGQLAPDPRLRGRPHRGAAGRQPRLDRPGRCARLPARRGQALHRERHVGQGVGPQPDRGRVGHLLHRVQLHAAPGQRLPVASRPRGVRAADRGVGPVGQHHRRHRPHPPAHRRPRPRAQLPVAAALRRSEVRQERGRRRVARRRPHLALRLLPVLDERRRP